MKISFYYCWTAAWRECEVCFIGPVVFNEGDKIRIGLGLFFLEVGIEVKRGNDQSNS
jgi:hypothetical protein